MSDTINQPKHYTFHKSGVEAIDICEQLGFNLGCAFKYLFRRDSKHESPLTDLKKALWYVNREVTNVQELTGGSYVAVTLNVPTRAEFDDNFFRTEFGYAPLIEDILAVLEHEEGWIAGAMAFIVRGSEHINDTDLQIAAYCIRQAIENAE